jgi:hypothetical protein
VLPGLRRGVLGQPEPGHEASERAPRQKPDEGAAGPSLVGRHSRQLVKLPLFHRVISSDDSGGICSYEKLMQNGGPGLG